MPPAAKGHQTLSAYISSRFDEFSRSQKDVAQYVVDHLDEVAFHTAEELARRASTSSSTVVRFAQALGFEGFPELQEAARDEYRHHHRRFSSQPAGLEPTAAPLFSLDQNPFEQAVGADHVNIEDTARKVSRSDVEAAIDLGRDDEVMDQLRRRSFADLLSEDWPHGVEAAVDLALLGRYYERIADHAVSVANRVVFVVTGDLPPRD